MTPDYYRVPAKLLLEPLNAFAFAAFIQDTDHINNIGENSFVWSTTILNSLQKDSFKTDFFAVGITIDSHGDVTFVAIPTQDQFLKEIEILTQKYGCFKKNLSSVTFN